MKLPGLGKLPMNLNPTGGGGMGIALGTSGARLACETCSCVNPSLSATSSLAATNSFNDAHSARGNFLTDHGEVPVQVQDEERGAYQGNGGDGDRRCVGSSGLHFCGQGRLRAMFGPHLGDASSELHFCGQLRVLALFGPHLDDASSGLHFCGRSRVLRLFGPHLGDASTGLHFCGRSRVLQLFGPHLGEASSGLHFCGQSRLRGLFGPHLGDASSGLHFCGQ